ncbi:trehalose-phosphatase [Natronosalvus vescus]|uniref:trehalose-phosphatase n=1 Tax=Natronosalvus vescus TaxID=2953881 RepID=UPI0020912AB8|nr:trehalose-phosphatase [Natronosalvus vescus]
MVRQQFSFAERPVVSSDLQRSKRRRASTQRIPRDLRSQIRAGLNQHDELLACFDFDGTLAPIVDDPVAASPLPAARRGVASLASIDGVTTAIVSGRALSDVADRIDGADAYAGNHGLELERDGSLAIHPIAQRRASLVTRCCRALESRLAPILGCTVENKRLTGTVHVRHVADWKRPAIRHEVETVVDRIGGDALVISEGKSIFEIGPNISWTKGDAVSLLESTQAVDPFVLYLGDDTTDETVFRRLDSSGCGVRVGASAETDASFRLESPQAVCRLLQWLVDVATDRLE